MNKKKIVFDDSRRLSYREDGIFYREGTITKDWDLIAPKIQSHWDEASLNYYDRTLDFDLEELLKLEFYNKLCCVGCRFEDEEGTSIGYALTVKMTHQMMRTQRHALMYGFFMDKEHRTYKRVKTLFNFLEFVLKYKHNVEYLQVSFSVNKDLRPLFKRWGYVPLDYVYGKSLHEDD